ncbi:hypothetical protein Aperf_G00000120753 [Anoplocephala perfoliata]
MSPRRNFSFVFLIGTKIGDCEPCIPAAAALSNIANNWDKHHVDSSEIFFGFIDFRENMRLVKSLQVTTAPFVFHVGPHQVISKWDKLNDFKVVSEPSLLAAWISKVSNVSVEATVPINLSLLYFAAGLLLVGYFCRKIKVLRSGKFIGLLCMLFVCTMCSGFMFVFIHSVPFMSVQEGRVFYIYPQNGTQFGCECLIIVSFYAMTSGGVIFLTSKCPKYRKRSFVYAICVLIGVGVSVTGFKQMAECYRMKTGNPPFHFSLR